MVVGNLNINEDRVREVLRVKTNMGALLDTPMQQPKGIKSTVVPAEKLELNEWFDHIKKSLREKDKFGYVEIK